MPRLDYENFYRDYLSIEPLANFNISTLQKNNYLNNNNNIEEEDNYSEI